MLSIKVADDWQLLTYEKLSKLPSERKLNSSSCNFFKEKMIKNLK